MVLNCPHCQAERVGFAYGGEHSQGGSPHRPPTWNTLFECRKCRKGVVVELQSQKSFNAVPSACHGDPRDDGFRLLEVHPKPQPLDIPRYLPEEIKRDYKEAGDCMRQGSFTAAGTMFRKVLERTTTELAVASEEKINLKGMTLKDRINKLANQQLIPPAMRDWAHQIRDDGNKAAHGEVEQAHATLMKHLTKLFLIYVFTLPEVVRLARDTHSDPNA